MYLDLQLRAPKLYLHPFSKCLSKDANVLGHFVVGWDLEQCPPNSIFIGVSFFPPKWYFYLEKCTGFLDTQVSLAPTHVSWLVGPSVGWSVRWSHFRISNLWSVTVAQIKKVQKTKSIYFRILLLGGPSPPTKMYMKA